MILTNEQRDNFSKQLAESEFSPQVKERVSVLLAEPELSEADLYEINSLLQDDMMADMMADSEMKKEIESDPEYKAIMDDTESKLKTVADDLDDSMNFVVEQTAELQKAGVQIEEVINSAGVADVKSRLGIAPEA
jgi:hypothetical protein